ncbi:MAG: ABC transporter permease [Trueperaceae bacterium]|nr:ABC transporter permease [Trueperaceae bacterium]
MIGYVVNRTLAAVVVVFGVSSLVFFMLHLLPGDAVTIMLSEFGASAVEEQQLREQLGLTDPILVQYGRFLANAVQGDFGTSLFSRRPVLPQIFEQLPKTLELAVAATIVGVLFGAFFGITAAIMRNTWWDSISMIISLLALSMPNFWLGLIFIFVFSLNLGWFPVQGSDTLWHVVLPALALGLSFAGLLARLFRSTMLEVLGQDFVRTARAKGVAEPSVINRHALKNALIPIVTVIGINFGFLLGGSVIIEIVFARQGIGNLIIKAIFAHDFYLVQGGIIVTAALFVLVNLIVDLTYGILDPRISYA